MNYRKIMHSATAFVATMMLCTALQAAGLFRAYLASTGYAANPCTLTQPCRLLPAALAAVADGGEIWMLDSANYNTAPVVISQSITILAVPGAVGSLVASGGDALQVNGAGVKVTLRNLVFVNVSGGSNNGVSFLQGASLIVRDSSFTGLTSAGVNVAAAGGRGQIVNSTFERNLVGISLTQGATLTVRDSSFTGHGSAGVNVAMVDMRGQIFNSTFDGNAIGVRVNGGSVNLANSNLVNNAIAVEAVGNGYLGAYSFGNRITRVLVAGGSITDNGTAFHMDDSGPHDASVCYGFNVFLGSSGANGSVQHSVNLNGNATEVNATGPDVTCVSPSISIYYWSQGTWGTKSQTNNVY